MFVDLLLWANILAGGIVGLLLLFRRPNSISMVLFALGLFSISALSFSDLQIINKPESLFIWRRYSLFTETLFVVACYFYTKTSFRDNSLIYTGFGFWISLILAVSLLFFSFFAPPETLVFSPDFAEEKILFLTNFGFVLYLLLMVFLVFGLVQLERSLAALHQLQRWRIKLEIIGSGLLIAAFAFYFSQSLLYRSINMNFLSARAIVILLAVGLFLYSQLFRDKGSRLALSRGIAYRSFVLLIVGGYLILLGLVGEGLRYLNVANAKNLFLILLMLGSLGLAVLFLSERLRRKFLVILHKNFYQSKYDYREQWENYTAQIVKADSLSETQVSVLELLCTSFACKGGAFYLLDHESGTYVNTATFNFRRDWRPFLETDALIVQFKQRDWIVNLHEPVPELAESLIDTFAEVGGFLVVPLFFDDDLIGFIILGEQINPDELLTYEDYDLLRMFARQVVATVQGRRLVEQLALSRELAAIGKVSTFVLHDLKNQVSGLALMHDNAVDYIDDPDFQQDMLETVGNTVSNMKELIVRLKNLKEKPERVVAPVELSKVVNDAVETVGGRIEVAGDSVKIAVDDEEIYKVVLNLLVNAIEATSQDESIRVVFGLRQGSAFVEVIDSGCGMSADYIQQRLFKPFETTKKHGFGIGLYQCKQIVDSHHGTISVQSKEGAGTKFILTLPLAPEIS